MSKENLRPDVVQALVDAYDAKEAWAEHAAVAFESSPTEAEKEEARRRVTKQRRADLRRLAAGDLEQLPEWIRPDDQAR